MPVSPLRRELCDAFDGQSHWFERIEHSFRELTARKQPTDLLCYFFQSWSQTNNSAMTVAGIGNRMTLLVQRKAAMADQGALFDALTSLNRIVDEDLAVTHKILHSQMYYRMATTVVGDDSWLSHRFVVPDAKAFKSWKDHNSLRDPDLYVALLTTLTHEIYTHGEVEFIYPLFVRWLRDEYGFSEAECKRTLGWISVHCGGTERNHFFHAVSAIEHFSRAVGVDTPSGYLETIVGDYLRKKAAVMGTLSAKLSTEADTVH
jgi:hypothetical protein